MHKSRNNDDPPTQPSTSESSSNNKEDPPEPTRPTLERDNVHDLATEQLVNEKKHARQARNTDVSKRNKGTREDRRPVARTNPKVRVTKGDMERVPRCRRSTGATYELEITRKKGEKLEADLLQKNDRLNSRQWQESFLSSEQRVTTYYGLSSGRHHKNKRRTKQRQPRKTKSGKTSTIS